MESRGWNQQTEHWNIHLELLLDNFIHNCLKWYCVYWKYKYHADLYKKIYTTCRQLNKLLSRAGAQSYICKTWNIERKLHGIMIAVKTFYFGNIFMRYSWILYLSTVCILHILILNTSLMKSEIQRSCYALFSTRPWCFLTTCWKKDRSILIIEIQKIHFL